MSTIHATAVLLHERALLITGAPNAGKSSLALSLIREARADPSVCVRLIADDRTHIEAANGRLIARTPAPIEGMIEERARGIIDVPYETSGVVALALELRDAPPRLPAFEEQTVTIGGVTLPRFFHGSRSGLSLGKAVELMEKASNFNRI